MRWLVGVTALLSACGLSKHRGSPHAISADGGSGGQVLAGAGASDGGGSPALDPQAGATGVDARPGSEHPRVPTAAAGSGSAAAGAGGAGSSAAAGGTGAGGLGGSGGPSSSAAGTASSIDGGGAGDASVAGHSGYALHFEVQSFASELIPLFDSQEDGGWATPHTFEAWFRTRGNVAPLVSAYDDDSWGALSLVVVNGGVCLHYEVGIRPPFRDICTQTRTLADGAWHHVAAVVNDSHVQLFEDGALSLNASVDLTLPDILDRLNLGTGTAGSEGQTVFLDGDLDEVRVWRGARTAAELANYRAVELTPSFEPDSDGNYLLAYLRLDDGTGANRLEDLGAAANLPAELNLHQDGDPWLTPGAF
jgi:hypothetical protein